MPRKSASSSSTHEGILHCRVVGDMAYISLNYEQRMAEHLFRKKARRLRFCLKLHGYYIRWNDRYKHWETKSGVIQWLTEDDECLRRLNARIVITVSDT